MGRDTSWRLEVKSTVSLLILLLGLCSFAQQEPEKGQTAQQEPAYKVGGGVSAPRVTHSPNAIYTEEARRAKVEGSVILWLVVGTDGLPHNIKVARGLGYGLDKAAVEAVAQWKFDPGKKNGTPVPVQINVQVNFHLT